MKKYLVLILAACSLLQACSVSRKSSSTTTDRTTGMKGAQLVSGLEANGSCYAKAIVIKSRHQADGLAAVYTWVSNVFPGNEIVRQSVVENNQRPYNILSIRTEYGDSRDVYFDISDFYGKL